MNDERFYKVHLIPEKDRDPSLFDTRFVKELVSVIETFNGTTTIPKLIELCRMIVSSITERTDEYNSSGLSTDTLESIIILAEASYLFDKDDYNQSSPLVSLSSLHIPGFRSPTTELMLLDRSKRPFCIATNIKSLRKYIQINYTNMDLVRANWISINSMLHVANIALTDIEENPERNQHLISKFTPIVPVNTTEAMFKLLNSFLEEIDNHVFTIDINKVEMPAFYTSIRWSDLFTLERVK